MGYSKYFYMFYLLTMTLQMLKYFVSRMGHECNSEQRRTKETTVNASNDGYLTIWLTVISGT